MADVPVRDPDEEAMVQELKNTRAAANPNMNPKIAKGEAGNYQAPGPAAAPLPQEKPKTIREHLQALFDHFGYK